MIAPCVNCRDDEIIIGRCIENVRNHLSKMLICDTGSQDRTKEVIFGHGLKNIYLYEKQWSGFLEARNWFFALTSQPYILQLDVDEVLFAPPAAARMRS